MAAEDGGGAVVVTVAAMAMAAVAGLAVAGRRRWLAGHLRKIVAVCIASVEICMQTTGCDASAASTHALLDGGRHGIAPRGG